MGATGSGKSCALVLILKGILDRNPHAHIVLLDPHGEYGQAFGDQVEHLNVRTFRFPYWLLNFEELVEVVFGDKKTEHAGSIAILRDLVLAAKLAFAGNPTDASWMTVDTPVPYALGEVNRLIDEHTGRLDNRANSGPLSAYKNKAGRPAGRPPLRLHVLHRRRVARRTRQPPRPHFSSCLPMAARSRCWTWPACRPKC